MGSPLRHQAIEVAKAQRWVDGDEDAEGYAESTAEVVMGLVEPILHALVTHVPQFEVRFGRTYGCRACEPMVAWPCPEWLRAKEAVGG